MPSRKALGAALIVLLSPAILYGLAYAAAGSLLTVRTAIGPADVILVLGGDGPARATMAAALFHQKIAPRILITGDGDCDTIAQRLIAEDVPAGRIFRECKSRNTWENALFSSSQLARMGVRKAVLVTSWFHMRRALGCFETVVPQISWMTAPTKRQRPLQVVLLDNEGFAVAKEYFKIAWYVWAYGIPLTGPRANETAPVAVSSRRS